MEMAYILHFIISFLFVMTIPFVVFYVLGSIGLYVMARNTGINDPWLAWLPGARDYLLGKLADRFLEANHKKGFLRILLPVLNVVPSYASWIAMIFSVLLSFTNSIMTVPAISIAALLGIAYKVCYLVSFYYVMEDYEPSRSVLYTILAFFNLGKLILFINRNNVPVGVAGRSPYRQPKYDVK